MKKFLAQESWIANTSEQRVDRVKHGALGADYRDGGGHAGEKHIKIDLVLNRHTFDRQLLLLDQAGKIEAEREDILGQFIR